MLRKRVEGEGVDCGGLLDWLSLTERSVLSLAALVSGLGLWGDLGARRNTLWMISEPLSIELFWWLEFLGVEWAIGGLEETGRTKLLGWEAQESWINWIWNSHSRRRGQVGRVSSVWVKLNKWGFHCQGKRNSELLGDKIIRYFLICRGYVWGGQHVRFWWHIWSESLKMCFFILLCIFRFTGLSRASRCGSDCHVSGGGHLQRQFRWESWWCKSWCYVQLLYVISVHVFAISVYNEDWEWGHVFSWWFSLVMVLCFVFKMIRFCNFFRGQL